MQESFVNEEIDIVEARSCKIVYGLLDEGEAFDIIICAMVMHSKEGTYVSCGRDLDFNAGFLFWYHLRKMKSWGEKASKTLLVVLSSTGVLSEIKQAMQEDEMTEWLEVPLWPSEIVAACKKMLDSK